MRSVDPLYEFALSVKAVQRELERATNEMMRPLGVTAPQADAIFVIGQAEPLALKDLAGLLIAEAGHPSRLVDRLVAGGLVERREAADDRRRVELSLTADGRRLEKRIVAAREQVFALGREAVGERDLEPALELFRELLEHAPLGEVVRRRRALDDRADRYSSRS